MNRFDRDTAIVPCGPAEFEAQIDGGWQINAGPNGGYLAAILLRAMTNEINDAQRMPRAFTTHYLNRPRAGTARVTTRIEREGRSVSSCSARLEQDGRTIALSLASFALGRESLQFQDARMPEVSPPEALEPFALPPAGAPFRQRYEYRPALGALPRAGAREALAGGWIRLSEPRPPDALLLAAMLDCWFPPVLAKVDAHASWKGFPTLDFTVHFRRSLPAASREPGAFLLGVFRSRTADSGFLEEDAELWATDGTLIAQARQLALLI